MSKISKRDTRDVVNTFQCKRCGLVWSTTSGRSRCPYCSYEHITTKISEEDMIMFRASREATRAYYNPIFKAHKNER